MYGRVRTIMRVCKFAYPFCVYIRGTGLTKVNGFISYAYHRMINSLTIPLIVALTQLKQHSGEREKERNEEKITTTYVLEVQ